MTAQHSPEFDARLTELWNQGYSASQIGAHLGVTKNSVIGRARRMGLVKRGSPIRYAGQIDKILEMHAAGMSPEAIGVALGKPAWRIRCRIKRGRGKRVQNLIARDLPHSTVKEILPALPPLAAPVETKKVATIKAVAQREMRLPVSNRPCAYITSDDKPWVYCGCRALVGKPYCATHTRICYRPANQKEAA